MNQPNTPGQPATTTPPSAAVTPLPSPAVVKPVPEKAAVPAERKEYVMQDGKLTLKNKGANS